MLLKLRDNNYFFKKIKYEVRQEDAFEINET